MKLFVASLIALAFPASFVASQQQCITGGFSVLINDLCNYPKLLAAFRVFYAQPFNINPGCTMAAEPLLQSLLGVTSASAADTAVAGICQQAFASFNTMPFREIPGPIGSDDFIKKYFNGGTDFNEHVATLFPSLSPGVESYLLSEEASNVAVTFTGEATYGMLKWPDFVPNFQTCTNNAAMCCWPSDRQANDGNGNCASPYDTNCVDADPGDNTNLCYTNFTASAKSTGYAASNAGITFPYDGQNNQDVGEGPIHCHGLAWADDVNHPSNVYKGNNLFYISMYDHMSKRGYVRNIPGAPMCACLEQMPVVSRSDCSQMNVQQNITFTYSGTAFTASVSDIDIVYAACQGLDPYGNAQNNDLWAYANKLFINNQIPASKLVGVSQNIVGNNPDACFVAEKKFWYQTQGLVRGYAYNASNWIQVAGTESFNFQTTYGKNAIDLLLNSSTYKLIRRVCGSCMDTHKHIFYKRLTPAPANLNILYNLMYASSIVTGQVYGKDYLLFSSYTDAIDPTNSKAWSCKPVNSTFPYWCGPENKTYDDSPARSFWSMWGAQDVAYYVEAGFAGATNVSVTKVGNATLPASAFRYNNKIYFSSSATGYGGQADNMAFINTATTTDVSMIVKVDAFFFAWDRNGNWAKAGLQIRESLEPTARYFAIAATGGNGIELVYRGTTASWSSSYGSISGKTFSPVWLKVNKRMDTFTAYTSQDGVTWTLFYQPINIQSFGVNSTAIQSGLVVTANDWANQYAEAVFSNYQNDQFYYPSSAPSSSPAPSAVRTQSSMDINLQNKNLPGSSFLYTRSAMWKVKSGGADIWSTSDSFHFVPFNTSNSNFTVQAYIPSYQPASTYSKAGVMIRESLNANSTNVFATLLGGPGVGMQWRPTTGASTQQAGFVWPQPGLIYSWVRLSKVGNTVTAYKKTILPDAEWISLGAVNITFTKPTLYVGMALASNSWGTYTTAKFQWFSINATAHCILSVFLLIRILPLLAPFLNESGCLPALDFHPPLLRVMDFRLKRRECHG